MQSNMEFESTKNGGSEQASSSDDGQFLVALRKMMKKEVEVVVIRTLHQMIVPIIGDLVRTVVDDGFMVVFFIKYSNLWVEIKFSKDSSENRKLPVRKPNRYSPLMVDKRNEDEFNFGLMFLYGIELVKDEIQSALLARNTNEGTTSKETRLQLKLLDEVSDPVLTGKPLKAKEGDSLKVVLVNRETGRVVENGPISSAKVEILVLDASRDDNEHNWTIEDFNSRIIREGDKERPHFSKNVFIYLEKGVGVLSNVKLGHDAIWMKNRKCRLGARIVGSFRGVDVQEARTGSFTVMDRRSRHYEKHYPPSLSDEVWRLDNIGRDGPPCKRLKKENVETVQDFLFLHSVDPHKLQELVGAGVKWKATLDHARTCTKDDKVYLHYPSAESKTGVIFDAVGGLKGIIDDFHYVPINDLSTDEKDSARDLLLSAFKNREARTSFDDEASLLEQFPYRSSVSEYNDGHYPVQPGISYQSNDAYIRPFASTDTVFDVPIPLPSCPFPDPGTSASTAFGIPNNIPHFGDPNMGQLHDPYWGVQSPNYEFTTFASSGDNWSLMSQINSMILSSGPPSCQQSNTRAYHLVFPVAKAKVWVLRAKKRIMALGGTHAHKKRKT